MKGNSRMLALARARSQGMWRSLSLQRRLRGTAIAISHIKSSGECQLSADSTVISLVRKDGIGTQANSGERISLQRFVWVLARA